MKVKVKIKESIARKGCGFYDIDGQQELFSRGKDGSIETGKVFVVEATPFIESKIGSGELVLIERIEDKPAKTDDKK